MALRWHRGPLVAAAQRTQPSATEGGSPVLANGCCARSNGGTEEEGASQGTFLRWTEVHRFTRALATTPHISQRGPHNPPFRFRRSAGSHDQKSHRGWTRHISLRVKLCAHTCQWSRSQASKSRQVQISPPFRPAKPQNFPKDVPFPYHRGSCTMAGPFMRSARGCIGRERRRGGGADLPLFPGSPYGPRGGRALKF